jgi:hypothetical protein
MVKNLIDGITDFLRIDTPQFSATMEKWHALEDELCGTAGTAMMPAAE